MDWRNLSSLVQNHLSQQLNLFVSKIETQDAEIVTLKNTIQQLEAKIELLMQQNQQQHPNVKEVSTSTSASTTLMMNMTKMIPSAIKQQQYHRPSSPIPTEAASSCRNHAHHPISAPPSPNSSQYHQARALSQMMADHDTEMRIAVEKIESPPVVVKKQHSNQNGTSFSAASRTHNASKKRGARDQPDVDGGDGAAAEHEVEVPVTKKAKTATTTTTTIMTTRAPPSLITPSSTLHPPSSSFLGGLDTQSIDPVSHMTPLQGSANQHQQHQHHHHNAANNASTLALAATSARRKAQQQNAPPSNNNNGKVPSPSPPHSTPHPNPPAAHARPYQEENEMMQDADQPQQQQLQSKQEQQQQQDQNDDPYEDLFGAMDATQTNVPPQEDDDAHMHEPEQHTTTVISSPPPPIMSPPPPAAVPVVVKKQNQSSSSSSRVKREPISAPAPAPVPHIPSPIVEDTDPVRSPQKLPVGGGAGVGAATSHKPSAHDLLTTSFPVGIAPSASKLATPSALAMPLSPLPDATDSTTITPELQKQAEQLATSSMTLAARGEWKLSLEKMNSAIELLSVKSWFHVPLQWLKQRSTFHAKLGSSSEAHIDAQRMIRYHPNAWSGYYILSTLLGRDKNYAAALKECKKAWRRVEKRCAPNPTTSASSDRAKIIERIRQLEGRLKLQPCVLDEDIEVDWRREEEGEDSGGGAADGERKQEDDGHMEEQKQQPQPILMTPPKHEYNHHETPATTKKHAPHHLLQTPQQQRSNRHAAMADELVSPSSTRAPTAPSSPYVGTAAATLPATNGQTMPYTVPGTGEKTPSPKRGGAAAAAASATTPGGGDASSTSKSITPLLTFGTYKLTGSTCTSTLSNALRLGYRRLDTATSYGNEEAIAQAITKSGISRSSIHITSKISWNETSSEEAAYAAVITTLKALHTSYLDELLIHFPGRPQIPKSSPLHASSRLHAWRACERVMSEGKARSIGVSNFEITHLQQLLTQAKIIPRVNQIELHPLIYRTQMKLIEYCRSHNIVIEAYASLGCGNKKLHQEVPLLHSMSKTCKRSVGDILLQWSLQHGFIPLVKSASPTHVQSNYGVVSKPFTLSEEQMRALDELEATHGKQRFCWDPTKFA